MKRLPGSALLILLLVPGITAGQVGEDATATLRGLGGVAVIVESPGESAEQAGLKPDDLKTAVELRLRSAGIRVLERNERLSVSGSPYLHLRITAMKVEDADAFVYTTEMSLHQRVKLTRPPNQTTTATTWEAQGSIGIVSSDNLSKLHDNARRLADSFANEYLAANEEPQKPFGAESGKSALEGFFRAVQSSDLSEMGRFYGTAEGPAERRLGPTEVKNRMSVLVGLLKHDSIAVHSSQQIEEGTRQVVVQLTGTRRGKVKLPVTVVRTQGGRWFIQKIDMQPLVEEP